jgi:hypothetical protein
MNLIFQGEREERKGIKHSRHSFNEIKNWITDKVATAKKKSSREPSFEGTR